MLSDELKQKRDALKAKIAEQYTPNQLQALRDKLRALKADMDARKAKWDQFKAKLKQGPADKAEREACEKMPTEGMNEGGTGT